MPQLGWVSLPTIGLASMHHDSDAGATAWRFSSGVARCALGETLFIVTETGSAIFEGSPFTQVTRLLDGIRSTAEISRLLAKEVDADAVQNVVRKLHDAGYVVRGLGPADEADSYVEVLRARSPAVSRAVHSLTVRVVAVGSTDDLAARIAGYIRTLGCSVTQRDDDSDLVVDLLVVVANDYLDPRLASVNARMLRRLQPWMMVKPSGRQAWIGPRFVPYETGCWCCLSSRLSGNRKVERFIADRLGWPSASRPSAGMLPGADGMVAAMIEAELLASLDGATPLTGRLRTVSLSEFETRHHVLTRLPQCPVCGDPSRARNGPTAVAETFARPERHRQWANRELPLDQVKAHLSDQLSPYLGAVSALKREYRGASTRGYTYVAAHDFPLISRNVHSFRRNLAMRSSGRGATPLRAQGAALCEAMERYCGGWLDGTQVTRSSWHRLDHRAVHPAEVLLISPRQYADRESWNEQLVDAFQWVPETFDESRVIDFTPAWSLTHTETVLVPAGLAWYGHPDLRSHPYAMTDSNGCAAGASLHEATLYALCEIYERDAVAIWWYNRISRPQVDVEVLEDPVINGLSSTFHDLGRSAWVLDITADLAMPTYAAVSCAESSSKRVLFGFGAHPDPRRAIRHALAEMDQLLPIVLRPQSPHSRNQATFQWLREIDCRNEPWLLPNGQTSPPGDSLPRELRTGGVGDVIDYYVEDLKRIGIETIVIDQSRPDIDMTVARVIAPGMRHIWRRTAPGRLFDVPPYMNWQARPTPEGELNPYSIFI